MTYNDIVDICSKHNELKMILEKYLREKNKIDIFSHVEDFDFGVIYNNFYVEIYNDFDDRGSFFYIDVEDFLDYVNGVK